MRVSEAVRAGPQLAALQARFPSLALGIIEVILVILMAWSAVGLLWVLLTPLPPLPHEQALRAPLPPTPGMEMPAASAANPFRRRLAVEGTPALEAAAPETALDLTLYGVRATAASEGGTAIIRLPDGSQRAFRPGENLVRDVTLAAVFPGHVLIERADGRRESLYLDEEAADRERTLPFPGEERPSSAPQAPAPDRGGSAVSFMEVRLTPVLEGGRVAGVRVAGLGDDMASGEDGLRDGDIVRAVDGVALTGADAMVRLGDSLRGREDVMLDVVRDGRALRLNVRLD